MHRDLVELDLLRCPACLEGGREVPLHPFDDGLTAPCGHVWSVEDGLARLDPDPAEPHSYYDSPEGLGQYLGLHFPDGNPLEPFLGEACGERLPPPYPASMARLLPVEGEEEIALVLGAACGRLVFELARERRFAVGLEKASTLCRAGRGVAEAGRAVYRRTVEGAISEEVEVPFEAPANAELLQGDALATPFSSGAFDLVTALNLLDRVPEPAALLREAARLVRPGGRLLVASPFTWRTEHTPRERWIAGFTDAEGQPVRGADVVPPRLEGFELEQRRDVPFFIRHHARSGQLGRTHAMLFRAGPGGSP